ncbi:MAG: helix-turn-helix domain-containing protein [Tannerellaceae bacterium]|jgi:DNA-binding Xre family transcriptional regulator|nr:helix-turn-helix domain-containing protein [Tannerellaceae bacterium]
MNLLIVKDILEKKNISIRYLADAIGMSEQNLYRCFRENKIQAGDLEKIAHSLQVSIGTFFEEKVTVSVQGSHNQLHNGTGDQNMSQSETTIIEHLNRIIEEKNKIIADKDKFIDFLLMSQNK